MVGIEGFIVDFPLVLLLLSLVLVTAKNLVRRVVTKREKDHFAGTVINNWTGGVMCLAAILIMGVSFGAPEGFAQDAIPDSAFIALGAAVLLYTFIDFLTFRTFHHKSAGESVMILQLSAPIAMLFAFIFLGESMGVLPLFGAALIIGGGLLVTYRKDMHLYFDDGMKAGLICAFISAFASTVDKFAIGYFPPLLYSLPTYLVPGIVLFAYMMKSGMGKAVQRVKKALDCQPFTILGFNLLRVVTYTVVLLAFRYNPLSIVAPVLGASVVISVIVGALFLGEKENVWLKIIGSVIAFGGLAILAG